MNIFWLQQTGAEVPAPNDWLSPNEALRLSGMRFLKRRGDWRLGRWTAKCAVASCLGWPAATHLFREIEIRPALSGAPQVFFAGETIPITISLTHRAGVAICATVPLPTALGCDLELVEPRSEPFIADYFTGEEQSLLAHLPVEDRPALLALLWSAKESALKALQEGLRRDTRSVHVSFGGTCPISGDGARTCAPQAAWREDTSTTKGDGWRSFQIRDTNDGRTLHGWWQSPGVLMRTVVSDPPLPPPVLIYPSADVSSVLRQQRR